MDENQIRQNIRERLGIERLNDMQLSMADVSDPLTVLIAPTGSGKTVAFAIAALRFMGQPMGVLQTLILAPTRELVMQTSEVVRAIARGYKTVALYGGHSMADEENSLIMTPDIIVATPGRLVDHIRRGHLRPGMRLHALVLDEYDKALELGFAPQIRQILRHFVAPEHVVLTSATPLDELPEELRGRRARRLDFSASERVPAPHSTLTVKQVKSPEADKLDTLRRLLCTVVTPERKAIVFVGHRDSAERVHAAMRRQGMPVGLYHGGLEQWERERTVELLNNGTTPILISTDLASRGLDIDDVASVIHYHQPPTPEVWVHRCGRTARQGAEGAVYFIIGPDETWSNTVGTDAAEELTLPDVCPAPPVPTVGSLYFNAGRKEKISRGDILGFLLANTTLQPEQIGRIALRDHAAIVAIPALRVPDVLIAVAHQKIKNRKVKITPIRG